jgi:hypothetical protein
MLAFGTMKTPDAAADRIGVTSYRSSFSTAATSKAKSRPSTRSLKATSIQHLRSEITATALIGLSLFFRLSTRNLCRTALALPVYMEVRGA